MEIWKRALHERGTRKTTHCYTATCFDIRNTRDKRRRRSPSAFAAGYEALGMRIFYFTTISSVKSQPPSMVVFPCTRM